VDVHFQFQMRRAHGEESVLLQWPLPSSQFSPSQLSGILAARKTNRQRDTRLKNTDCPRRKTGGGGGDGHQSSSPEKMKASQDVGRGLKGGRREEAGPGSKAEDPETGRRRLERGGPLISAIPPGGLPLRFPSREKAPVLLQHDL
jgi:hypothetical protein